MTYAVGSLVRARGREWVVLPESEGDLLVLRPLGGTEDEVTGILQTLESVAPARFELPDPSDLAQIGDHRSARLLRDAVRLGFRSSAGPFRSFGAIAVEPRPYQLVPLLLALKLDPVRMLVADDVGIGKTIEAGLIAKELLARGEVERLAVLCPPALAEQWQKELADKFHIEAELVLASTAARLERGLGISESLFDRHPFVVVSTDFIKSPRRIEEFKNACPELVIVDEAHTCASAADGRSAQIQRHRLVSGLAADPARHLILVTATPHSGKEDSFRSLLGFLDADFLHLPQELGGDQNRAHRQRLARHFVQRRRGDIRRYLDEDTPFPDREELEETYKLSSDYKKLFDRVLRYARETVTDPTTDRRRQRVRWWSALALLRSLASSPASAAATMRTRAATADTDTAEEADEIGRRTVMDLMDAESAEGSDVIPGSDPGEGEHAADGSAPGAASAVEAATPATARRRLLDMAREAERLMGSGDVKLTKATALVAELIDQGYRPIVFSRFIPTSDYVAEHLCKALKNTEVASVTGTLPPAEREERVLALGEHERHALVCTDCLSEGINLQEHFDAVIHYDLAWNPTRHEQREGRVDRYGQTNPKVRVLTYYGTDNQIDGIVLDVLIQKHKRIRDRTGISVPVPVNTEELVEALLEGLVLREQAGRQPDQLMLEFEDLVVQRDGVHRQWEAAADREKRSRTMFAQETIRVEEVAAELAETRAAIGSGAEVERFVRDALVAHKAVVTGDGSVTADLSESPTALREAIGLAEQTRLRGRFELPVGEGEVHLARTHPAVEGLAAYVADAALDALEEAAAKRMGVIRTNAVDTRTTLLLLRLRFHINDSVGRRGALLAEECRAVAFRRAPGEAEWLDDDQVEALLATVAPSANIAPDQARNALERIIAEFDAVRPHLDQVAEDRAAALAASHERVRQAARTKGGEVEVRPELPPDVLGVYVYLPGVAP